MYLIGNIGKHILVLHPAYFYFPNSRNGLFFRRNSSYVVQPELWFSMCIPGDVRNVHDKFAEMRTHLIQLVTVDLSCLGWHSRMVMVSVHVLLWCDLCLMLIQSNSPTNHSPMDDDLSQLSDPNVNRAGHQEYCSPTKTHLGQHTVNWVFVGIGSVYVYVCIQFKLYLKILVS